MNMANPKGGYAQPSQPLNDVPPSQRSGGVVSHGRPVEPETMPRRASGLTLTLISLASMTTLALITCKILGLIDWPIAWVLSPLWIAVLLGLFVLFAYATVSGIVAAVKGK